MRARVERHRLLVGVGLVLVLVGGGLWGSRVAFDRSCAGVPEPGAFVTVDGVRLHYLDRGSGPPVVLLHGDGGSVLDLTASPLVDLLADRARVVAIDRPGHGYSDPADTVGSLREQAALVRGAVRSLELTDPILVGHSRGATVVAAYLDAFGDEVAAAVSIGGDLLGEPDPGDYGAYRPATWPVVGPVVVDLLYPAAVRAGDHRLLRDALDRAFAPEEPAPSDYVTGYACRWTATSTLQATYRLMEDTRRTMPAIRAGYPELAVPVVLVHGDADGNVPLGDAERAHQLLATSHLRVIPGGGHELQFTRPEEVVGAIELARALADAG
ncbi:MAG: alpha/beta fold hydrolase [Nitriliruptoraceae bacterium]